jgi:ATP-dependent RNA/DNA helicase IGHMBP2
MHPHLEALADALRSEEAFQRAEQARLSALTLEERIIAGATWAPLVPEDEQWVGRGQIEVLVRAARGGTLHDGIGIGDLVQLGSIGAPNDGPVGRCVGRDERTADIRIDAPLSLASPLAASRVFDPSTFARYHKALERADAHGSPLKKLLLGDASVGEPDAHGLHDPGFERLNISQHRAARIAMAAAEIALIHGPPGTGKTEVIVALLKAFVSAGDRPWALAESNAATDHLVARAHAAGLHVVRIGNPNRIRPETLTLSLDWRVRNGPMSGALRNIERELMPLHRDPELWQERRALYQERERILSLARHAVLERAEVIASTFGTLARMGADLPRPDSAIVDEATQALEPAIWSAVPWVRRLILVGDPHQLGPVVREPNNPLSTSLLERLLASDVPMPMLATQHRMASPIQALVERVYPGLRAHPDIASHRLCDLDDVLDTELTRTNLLWVDTAGADFTEERDPVTLSLFNEGEIRIVTQAVTELLRAGVGAASIGVIAPYSCQVARLSAELPTVEVATVNAFQGREKEAIVCSFVRSNGEGELGFVHDPRRLIVAITRARRFLLCVGDSGTLASSRHFEPVMDRFQAARAWATVWEDPWAVTLT